MFIIHALATFCRGALLFLCNLCNPYSMFFDQKPLFMLLPYLLPFCPFSTFAAVCAYLLPFLCTQTLATFIAYGF